MRVITWKEMFEIRGDVVWGYYSEDRFPENVYIQYNSLENKRVCEEGFPILEPEYKECIDWFSTLCKFQSTLEGKVSSLETSGDIYNREDEDTKIVIYDKEDILQWITKLTKLNIDY